MDEMIGFGRYQSCDNRGVLDVCLCLGGGDAGGVCVEWVGGWPRIWMGVLVLFLCEL